MGREYNETLIASVGVQTECFFIQQCTPDVRYYSHSAAFTKIPISLKISSSRWGSVPPSYTWFLGLTQVNNPNGVSNCYNHCMAHERDRQTDRQTMLRITTCTGLGHICAALHAY